MTVAAARAGHRPPVRPDTVRPVRQRRSWAVWDWVRAHPGLVIVLVIPPALFLGPQLVGRVFVDGDNFIQNFPLRVLVAADLRHGSPPLMDPYLFSGTPLLAGFNAGAAYPATWLLAVLPHIEAWSLNMALAYDLAALGTYLFLRRQSLSVTAATFAAATFAFAGYMSGQIVHIDLVEAAAWLPWTLLAVDALLPAEAAAGGPAIPRAAGARRTARWAAVLAGVVGLTLLTGGVEAAIDGLVAVAGYTLWQLVSQASRGVGWRAVLRSVAWTAGGLLAGLALGTAQWLPGLEFTSQSHRAAASYQFFIGGSLDYHLLVLLVSPFILGTNQSNPTLYVGQYNLPEVTAYMGVLALVAAAVLWSHRFRSRPRARAWRVWYALGALGLLSALGGETPFGGVLFAVPLVREERLLNRNLLIVDFALAVLLGWWLHELLTGRDDGAGAGGATGDRPAATGSVRPAAAAPARSSGPASRLGRAIDWRPGRRAEIVLTAAPAALVVVATAGFWADGPLVLRLLYAQSGLTSTAHLELAGLVTLGAGIAVAATVVVLVERRLRPAMLRRLLAAVLVADLVVLTTFMLQVPLPVATALARTPQAAALTRATTGGRFLVYDPDQLQRDDLYAIGQTDLNVFGATPSGQGYTALTDGAYYRATGAHYQEDLDPASLRGPAWDTLDATTLLSVPGYFVTPLGPTPPTATASFPPQPSPEVRDYTGAPLPTDRPVLLAPGRTDTWYLGGLLSVAQWSVTLARGDAAALEAGEVTAAGDVRWLDSTSVASSGATLAVSGPRQIAGVVVRNRSSGAVVVRPPHAVARETGPVALDGRLQYGVQPPHWRFAGTLGPFAVYRNTRARGWAWATGPGGGPEPAGTTVRASAPGADGGQRIGVRAGSPVELVRSVAWTAGWRATARPAGGPAGPVRSLDVQADGVVQRVAVPAGDWTVDFTYRPASAARSIAVSALCAVGLVGWLAVDGVLMLAARRRERRRGPPGPGDQAGERSPMASAARP